MKEERRTQKQHPEFDAIVIGAGPAGSAAALTLARKGVNVLVLEKAKIPGERNMTGGVLYGTAEERDDHHGMLDIIPDFEADAPVQRKIISHEVTVLSDPDWEGGTYRFYRLRHSSLASRLGLFRVGVDSGHDYSVLRRDFDQWFATRAVQEGAMLSTQTTAEQLIKEDGSVVGVRTSHEDLRSNVVIDCSGVTSNFVEAAGLRRKLVPEMLYHGLKHVFKLDPSLIEKRFKVEKGEGRAQLYLGNFMKGVNGGAFIYTNKDTLSVGVVVSMDSMLKAFTTNFDVVGKALDLLESFEGHPMISRLLDGAEMVEYAAHNVPKGYKCMLQTPYSSGYLASGDALGAFVKVGPLLDGMRRAIASGMMAGEAYIKASASGDFGATSLSTYKELLAPIYSAVARSRRDAQISESRMVYQTLPKLIFGLGPLAYEAKIRGDPQSQEEEKAGRPARRIETLQRVQLGTSLLNYDEDKVYSHIKVDLAKASSSPTKPWVPCCPVNCYTVVTSKGVYASFKDLYDHNASPMRERFAYPSNLESSAVRTVAVKETLQDVAAGQLRFDHVACVACGTCGEIGPRDIVAFNHEREGHGVRYRYG